MNRRVEANDPTLPEFDVRAARLKEPTDQTGIPTLIASSAEGRLIRECNPTRPDLGADAVAFEGP